MNPTTSEQTQEETPLFVCSKCDQHLFLQNWKKFSTAVDNHNKKMLDIYNEQLQKLKSQESFFIKHHFSTYFDLRFTYECGLIDKTIENFMEYQAEYANKI